MPFTDVTGRKSGVAQALTESGQIEVGRHVVAEDAVAVRIKPRKQSRARGPADRRARIGTVEPDTLGRESVDVRSAQRQLGTVATDTIGTLSVDEEENGLSCSHRKIFYGLAVFAHRTVWKLRHLGTH